MQVSQGFAAFCHDLTRIPPRHSQSKCATNCANPGYEIQTDPTAGCSNSGVCLQMATPQNLTAVHVACRKRTECRRKTILYFTEICRKVKSYIEEAPCPYGHGALILATAAAIAATAVVAAAPTAAAAAAQDDDEDDDPQTASAAPAVIAAPHMSTSRYESLEAAVCRSQSYHMRRREMGSARSGPLRPTSQRRPGAWRPPPPGWRSSGD